MNPGCVTRAMQPVEEKSEFCFCPSLCFFPMDLSTFQCFVILLLFHNHTFLTIFSVSDIFSSPFFQHHTTPSFWFSQRCRVRVMSNHSTNHRIHVIRNVAGSRDDNFHHHVNSERRRTSKKIRLTPKNYFESFSSSIVRHRLSITLASISKKHFWNPRKHFNIR